MADFMYKDKEYIITNGRLIIVFTEIEQDSDEIKSKINSENTIGLI